MSKFYFSYLILLIFISIEVFSQTPEFAPVGAKWYYSYENPYFNYYNYLSYESVGDTIIQDKRCNIVETTSECVYYDSVKAFLHTAGDRVDVFKWGSFHTLFNFGASPGDEWIVPNFEAYKYETCDSFKKVVVDSVSTELINGRILRILYLKFDPWPPSPKWWWQNAHRGPGYGKIIEIIGSPGMLFPRAGCEFEITYPSPLRCYSDSIFGFYDTGEADSCNQIKTSLNEAQSEYDKLKVFPNPSEGIFTISGLTSDADISIYDLRGRIVPSESISNSFQWEFLVQDKGFYIARIRLKDGFSKTIKISVY